MGEFANINEVYQEFFSGEPPARSVVEVSRLPKDVLVEDRDGCLWLRSRACLKASAAPENVSRRE